MKKVTFQIGACVQDKATGNIYRIWMANTSMETGKLKGFMLVPHDWTDFSCGDNVDMVSLKELRNNYTFYCHGTYTEHEYYLSNLKSDLYFYKQNKHNFIRLTKEGKKDAADFHKYRLNDYRNDVKKAISLYRQFKNNLNIVSKSQKDYTLMFK